jgi:poly(3-hydroxyalkanoate) depolymerase
VAPDSSRAARSETESDPASGLVITLHEIGRQTLRVGVRGGNKARPPLLLLNGIGANIELAAPFLHALRGPEAVIFDVPGVGGSSTPLLPYRPWQLARLVARLLDRLGYECADVLGVSWGGTIAQQFAFQHASRCRRLVLAATSPGQLMVPGRLGALLRIATRRRYKDPAYMERVAGEIYGGAFRKSPVPARQHLRYLRPSSDYGYFLQLLAGVGWTSLPWLRLLRQPTLVLMGSDDPLVPVINGHILATLIPNARLVTIDDGHLFLVTSAEESARVVSEFLLTPALSARVARSFRTASEECDW